MGQACRWNGRRRLPRLLSKPGRWPVEVENIFFNDIPAYCSLIRVDVRWLIAAFARYGMPLALGVTIYKKIALLSNYGTTRSENVNSDLLLVKKRSRSKEVVYLGTILVGLKPRRHFARVQSNIWL